MVHSFQALAVVLAAVSTLAAGRAHAADILVGQSVPLSGPLADIGRDMRDGAAAYLAYEAARHAGARPIKLMALDNVNDKDRARSNGKDLIANADVVALFGFSSATVSVESQEAAAQAGLLFFAPFTGASVMRDAPNFYSVRASYKDEAAAILEHKQTVGATKAMVLHYDDAVGKANLASVVQAFTEKNLAAPRGVAVPRSGNLPAGAFADVFAQEPHYVISTVRHDRVGELLKAAKDKGATLSLAALSFVNPDELSASLGDLARGTVVTQVVPSPTASNIASKPALKECADALHAMGGLTLNYTRLEACLAAKVLAMAVRKAGTNPTRAGVLQAMGALGKVDLGGVTVDFSGGRRHGARSVDLTILARGNRFVR